MRRAWWLREMAAAPLGVLATLCVLLAALWARTGEDGSALLAGAVAAASGAAGLWLRLGPLLRAPKSGDAP